MKNIAPIIIVTMLTFVAVAQADGPYLTADPVDGANAYEVEINGEVERATMQSGVLWLDLDYVPVGEHTVKARAVDNEGWRGPWSDPFVFERPVLLKPGNVRITPGQ
jgi:hypothetical protein